MVEIISEDVLEWARDLRAIQTMFAEGNVQPSTTREPAVIFELWPGQTRQGSCPFSSPPSHTSQPAAGISAPAALPSQSLIQETPRNRKINETLNKAEVQRAGSANLVELV